MFFFRILNYSLAYILAYSAFSLPNMIKMCIIFIDVDQLLKLVQIGYLHIHISRKFVIKIFALKNFKINIHQFFFSVDLVYEMSLGQISHDSKVDWLELSENSRKLLFRDKRLRLTLVDVSTRVKTTILSYATFVQVKCTF